VTAQTKARTRQKILDAARQLFASNGFDAATTRDIADAAGIASGTLFNYFPTKEAVLASLAAEAVSIVHDRFGEGDPEAESFEEDIFAFVAAGLRQLKPLRKHMAVLLETALSPLATGSGESSQSLRVAHLEVVAGLAKKHQLGDLSPVALQLYWTLYTGVLSFWSSDRSTRQEETLALLDHSLAMFVGWLEGQADGPVAGKTKGKV
jgi:AcrR family transcriptional regulator